MSLDAHHQPYWADRCGPRPDFAPLPGDAEVDIVVMGGGIAGVTAAALCHEAGRRVALVEMNTIGSGTTGHSTGHLDTSTDQDFHTLRRGWNDDEIRAYVDAKYRAIDLIERLDREHELGADVVRYDAYVYAEPDQDVESFEKELDAVRALGLPYEPVAVPLPFPTAAAMRLPGNGRFDCLTYTVNLARRLAERGVAVHERTRLEEASDDGAGVRVQTDRGVIRAERAILMGHAPVEGPGVIDTRTRPYQSYVIGVRVEDAVPDHSYYDWAEPYHYTRRASSDEPGLLIIGGADHATGEKGDQMRSFLRLEDYARKRFRVREVTHRWSHEYWEPADGMPFIGRAPGKEHVYFATGFSGEGLTFGTVSAMLLSDLALGRPNPWEALFSPERGKVLAGAKRIATAGLEAVKGLVVDRAVADADGVEAIAAGQGAVVKVEGEELAVYRDDAGDLHALSPVCRHQGCIVHFNNAERTWDCPCHGARYDVTGRVLTGPARDDLPRADLPAAGSRASSG